MKPLALLFSRVALSVAALFVMSGSARAGGLVNQSIVLRPGWNAIWLEVSPTNDSPSAVFAGVNIDSVWGWNTRLTTAQYIRDAAEPVWNADAMLMFVPTNRVESFQNNLNSIQGNRPYLVKLLGSSSVTVTLTGTPDVPTANWQADVFNLRGFPVDSLNPPSFLNYFKYSPAHFISNALNPIYTLNSSGTWVLVGPNDLMQSGIAYWVKCTGASQYLAPMEARVPVLGSLDFDLNGSEVTLELQNRRTTAVTATVGGLAIGTGALSLVGSTPTAGLTFTAITGNLTQALAASAVSQANIRISRNRLPSDDLDEIVTVTDGLGIRIRIPLKARRISVGTESDPTVAEAKRRAGLWVGYVTLNGVSEAHSGPITTMLVTNESGLVHEEQMRLAAGVTPTAVAQAFKLKLMLHVDTNGTTRLLKEVIQMFAAGATVPDTDGGNTQTPGHYVLLTDESLIPRFGGAQVVDGKSIGRRISTADYDFPSPPTNNFLAVSGQFAISNLLTTSITLSPNFPTNPFRHKFHPDHDNLGPDFKQTAARPEVYEVRRDIEIMPTPTDPGGKTAPEYGDDTIGGTYKETVMGLHKTNIVTAGTFSLKRISSVGVLNK
jgi:hypothetical protein